MSINIAIPTETGTQQFSVALPIGGIGELRKFVKICLGQPDVSLDSNFILTDALKDISTDQDVAQLRDGSVVMVAWGNDGALAGPTKERISFQPHPKTLTMAGDYEYFAAQVL